MNLKIKVRFKDRVGIVADISKLIAEQALNIVLMEVIRPKDEAHVFVELENTGVPVDEKMFSQIFNDLQGFVEFRFIEILPQDERANRFRVVLDNISDGVISIDNEGRITTIKKVASKVFKRESIEMIGKKMAPLNLPEYPLLQSLKGKKLDSGTCKRHAGSQETGPINIGTQSNLFH